MFLLPFSAALVVAVWTSLPIYTIAHSLQALPIKRVAQPQTLSLEILPRSETTSNKRNVYPDVSTLRYDDSFRLTISAFNETFYLHLRPNDNLIHPAARIVSYKPSPEGTIRKHTEPLLRETVKAFWGEVVADYHSPVRMREDGARVVHSFHPADLGFAYIIVHNQADGDMSVEPEYEGAFSVDGNIYHIMTQDNYLRRKHPLDPNLSEPSIDTGSGLVIWRESDLMTPSEESVALGGKGPQVLPGVSACGHDRLSYNLPGENPLLRSVNSFRTNPPWADRFLYPRDDVVGGGMGTNFAGNIGDTTGCPTSQKVIFMGVAADCEYVKQYGSQDDARKAILTGWNTASALYKSSFNVSLGIVELQVQSPTCPSQPDPNLPWNVPCSSALLDDRLSIFSRWRGQKGEDGAGLWHLMSGCPTGSEVGIAWLATLCKVDATSGSSNESVSGTGVSTSGRTEWQVIAHEIGHNFGAIHDCSTGCANTDSCCPLSTSTCDATSRFLMSPVSQSSEQSFSPCTLGNICSLMKGNKLNTDCLADPGSSKQIISLQMCGNGIVEQGEDCDPGSGASSNSSNCCDSSTCKFKSGAVCDPASSPCCTNQCSFAPSTQVCRPSKDTKCDSAETCTGNSSTCPSDRFESNGKSCGSDLACASGVCTSPSLQCQSIGGSMGLNASCPNRGDTSCQVSCQDPTKPNTCLLLGTLLVDGSPCGYGGTCNSGKCKQGSLMDTIKGWYTQNLQIAIPVTIAVGIAVLLFLWAFIRAVTRCCGGRRRTVVKARDLRYHARLPSHETGYLPPLTRNTPLTPGSGYNRIPVTDDVAQSRNGNRGYPNRSGWVDSTAYNGR